MMMGPKEEEEEDIALIVSLRDLRSWSCNLSLCLLSSLDGFTSWCAILNYTAKLSVLNTACLTSLVRLHSVCQYAGRVNSAAARSHLPLQNHELVAVVVFLSAIGKDGL
jgi:hypothetical protein